MTEKTITVIAVKSFREDARGYWTDDQYRAFVDYIAKNPLAGAVIPGSGGLRKVRWSRPGMGKSGGVRVIYYVVSSYRRLFLMTIYAKSERENLAPKRLRKLSDLAHELLEELKRHGR